MADKIDELELLITVTENQTAKKITKISEAISQLTDTLAGLNNVSSVLDKLNRIKIPSSLKNIKNLKIGYTLQTASLPQEVTKQNNFNNIQTGKSLKTQIEAVQTLRTKTEEVATAEEHVTSQIYKSLNVRKRASRNIFEMFKQEKKLGEQQKNNNKRTKESTTLWSKLTRSIARIGFYRIVRTTLNLIAKGLVTGIQNIRSANEGLDNSLNRISASTTTLQNSMASMLAPLIQSFEPIFTRISDSIANVVNRVNEAKAAMSGQSNYTKILTSDTEEYQKALEKTNGSLLEFDTFTTLASKDKGYTGTIKAPVEMSTEEAGGILDGLNKIKQTITEIGIVIGAIAFGSLLSNLTKVSDKLKDFKNPLNSTKLGITSITVGIALLVSGIKDSIAAFRDGGSAWEKTSAILKTLAGALGVVFGILVMTKATTTAKTWVGVIAGIAAAGAIITGAISTAHNAGKSIQSFANGGSFQTADMFYANENGRTELVASSNSGGGAVMNIDQWATVSESSFYNALARYGAAKNNGSFDTSSLGRSIAGDRGFINEMNRRNHSLNLK